MPTVTVDGCEVILSNYHREPTGVAGMELLTVDLTYKMLNESTAHSVLPPAMEVRDDLGNVYPPVVEDTPTDAIDPGGNLRANPRFEIDLTAQNLDLVVGPGTADEAHIELV